MECLDDNIASEFVSGSLPKTAVTKVETHLAGCRDCRDLVAALAGGEDDSQGATRPHEKFVITDSGSGLLRTWSVGDRVGRYLVLSAIGSGGMGVVFSAYDPQLDRKVALKLLRTNSGINSKEARARLRREAQAIAQLSHPNVVNVYDVGATDDGDVYIAMEFVEGDTLTHWLRKFSRTPREIIDVFLQAARGLYAAHAVGLLHRDFKPDNVLVGGDGRVRVTDFGLARSVLGPDEAVRPNVDTTHLHVELTATGTVLGTPRYMPPEQLSGPDIDARSDQFSFCVALYEALYSSHPLPGGTAVQMLDNNARAIVPPEKKGLPSSIAKAVLRGLEKDRAKRFPTMATLIVELAPRVERSPFRFAAIALATVIVAGAAAAAAFASRDPRAGEQPFEENETKTFLLERLTKVEAERDKLKAAFTALSKAKAQEGVQLIETKTQLAEKEGELQNLRARVVELGMGNIEIAAPTPPPPIKKVKARSQSELVIGAVDADVFAGCFKEWSERKPTTDADLAVRIVVPPDGHGYSAEANGSESPMMGPTGDISESLKFCVRDAMGRIRFPPGPEELDILASVRWSHTDKLISLSATIVGRRTPPKQVVDIKN